MDNKQVTVQQFCEFLRKYNKLRTIDDTPFRLGQAFCNEFHITDSFLFYVEDNTEAMKLITIYLTAPEKETIFEYSPSSEEN